LGRTQSSLYNYRPFLSLGGNTDALYREQESDNCPALTQKGLINNFLLDIKNGMRYFLARPPIRNITLVNMATNLLIASINVAFYAFAFDVLKVSNSVWGIMMSLFYGANLASMSVSIYFNRQIRNPAGYVSLSCLSW